MAWLQGQGMQWLAAGAGVSGALTVVCWWRWVRARSQLQQRLRRLAQAPDTTPSPGALWARHASGVVDRVAGGLTPLLAAAGLSWRPSTALLLLGASLLVLTWLGAHITRLPWLPVLAALALALWPGSRQAQRALCRRNQRVLEHQLIDVARMLSGALRAGLSIPQGFELMGQRLPDPAGPLLRRVHGELLLGVPMEEALAGLERHVDSADLRMLVLAIRLHREVGGDLAGTLSELARTLSERDQVQAAVRSAVAEPRYVAMLLPFMPFACVLLMNMLIPGFIKPLFSPIGALLLVCFLVSQAIGLAVVRRIARIQV